MQLHMIDEIKLMDDYLYHRDWRIKENSNITHSFGGMVNHIAGTMMAKYWMEKVYPKAISEAHKNGDFHVHDANFFGAYCNGIDLEMILREGLNGVTNQTSAKPPKHFTAAINMSITIIYLLQAEFAGAQSFSQFDTLLAPFVKYDGLTYDQVYQIMQNFIWSLNYSTRLGFQSAFSNITFDLMVPDDKRDECPYIGGKLYEAITYGDCQAEMDMINRAFIEIMSKGDADGRGFSYPIPTYNITPDFNWDSPTADALFQMTGKFGIPYFQNMIGSGIKPGDIKSMCCFQGDTLVKTRIDGVVKTISFAELKQLKYRKLEVLRDTEWVDARPIRVLYFEDWYQVCMSNGKAYLMTADHINPTLRGGVKQDLAAEQLKPGDKLYYRTDDIQFNVEIIDINLIRNDDSVAYCVEVLNGTPYFQLEDGLITHNCRLGLSLTELRQNNGGFFGAGASTGSCGVVSLNLPRLGYLAEDEVDFIKRLDALMDLAKDSLEIKRKVVTKWLGRGLYPYTKRYVGTFKNFFSTIGIIGGHECCMNLLGSGIETAAGKAFMLRTLDHIRRRLVVYQQETGHLYNLEETPAESSAGRLAAKDVAMYPQMYFSGNDVKYYTNSIHLPVNYSDNVYDVLDHQNDLIAKFNGGSVVHLYLGEAVDDINALKSLVRKVCTNYTLPYFTISPSYSICDTHGYLRGEQHTCPHCAAELADLETRLAAQNNTNKE